MGVANRQLDAFSSGLRFLSPANKSASPTDFQFDAVECRHRPTSYRERKLPVLDHSAVFIESMDNQRNLLSGGGGLMKGLINCCHKQLQWTLLLVSSQPGGRLAFKQFFNKKDWDAGMEATSMTSINSPLCNTISIYQLVFSTIRSNGRLSTPIIAPIYLLICLLCSLPRGLSKNLMWTLRDMWQ